MNAFIAFWCDLEGSRFLVPYLDIWSWLRLASAAVSTRSNNDNVAGTWHLTAEVNDELRMRSRLRAKMVATGKVHRAAVPIADVMLPHKNIFTDLPEWFMSKRRACKHLIVDFRPVIDFQDRCSHSSVLLKDPWAHVVLRLFADPSLLDRSLETARRCLPHLESLMFSSLPSLSIMKKMQQPDDCDDPLAFPVIRLLSSFQNLKVLALESAKPHPNLLGELSWQAFDKLTGSVLPSLKLEKLVLTTFLVHDMRGNRYGMRLTPFLQLTSLRSLRLAAVAYADSQQDSSMLCIDLNTFPKLEELDILFLAGETGGLAAAAQQAPASRSPLRMITLTDLGSSALGLQPSLAWSLASCPRLEVIKLSGPTLQAPFMSELTRALNESAPKQNTLVVDWTWTRESTVRRKSATTEPEDFEIPRQDAACLEELSLALARHGGALKSGSRTVNVHLRMSCEEAAAVEQKPMESFTSFGQGMDWWLGTAPPDMTMEQRAIINQRFSQSTM